MRTIQRAYDFELQAVEGRSLEQRMATLLDYYLTDVLGRSPDVAQDRREFELSRAPGAMIVEILAQQHIPFKEKRVLDLGAGLGTVSTELALHGARVLALEPGSSWRAIVAERLRGVGHGVTVAGVGEFLPFADNSMDLVVSRQVLEHVQDPARVIREVYRVMRPGSFFYFDCVNYLAFWEPHYNVPWFPLLPKKLGAIYLKLLGRSPEFLLTSISYTTLPSVRRQLREAGFLSTRDRRLLELATAPRKLKSRWKRPLLCLLAALLPVTFLFRMLQSLDLFANMFRRQICELAQKPVHSQAVNGC